MNRNSFLKSLAVILVLIMVVSALPISALAAAVDYTPHDDYYKVISKDDYDLAPGIVESEIVLNNAAGSHRQVAHVVEVDLSNPYTKVIPSYKGMVPTPGNYGVQIMSQQAAYAEANGYGNVVAAMNLSLSWYDSAYYLAHPELVGEPLGYMVLDGEVYVNSQGQTAGAQTCVVINFDEKDGEARPADMPKVEIRSTSSAITGWEEQVIPANFGFLVKNGKNQYSKDNNAANGASRSFVGIKADGTFVMVMNDGRQAPYSTGFTNYEMAEFMLSLGCIVAVNGDGGGSSAFLSQRPGEELKINCVPSDGAERETTHGILVISTAPVTGEFVRATVYTEYDYFTPGSTVSFSAVGSDLVGTAADIPADAYWQLADASFGTINDGVFVSNGKLGDVTAQLVYNDQVVGSHTISVVMPDTLTFALANMTIPYGKTVDLGLSATYDYKNVVLKPSDVIFTLTDANIGTIDGFDFTAGEEGVAATDSLLTATVGEVSTSTNLSLGKGSEIIYDFENQDLTGWKIFTNYGKYGPNGPNGKVTDADGNYWYHGQNERGYISVVDSTTGKVKNGNYSLAVECDFTQIYETGYHALNLTFPTIDCTDTVAIGFWLYIPYDARHVEMKIGSTNFGNGQFFEFNEGWHYITAQAANNQFYYINISVDDRAADTAHNNYNYIEEPNVNGKYTFYIDDITLDYSTAVDDREAPIFSNPMVANPVSESLTVMNGQVINYSNPSFEVSVVENTALTNAVGIDGTSAKAYVDGKQVDCNYTNGKITLGGMNLADGYHTVKFFIADKNGNESWVAGSIVVAAGNDAAIKVVPKDPTADRIFVGSLYWMDVVASNIETIEKVELVFDMNNASSWELQGMEVAAGFTASYSIQNDDNIATIIIEKTGNVAVTGEATLITFPVRTWTAQHTTYEGYEFATPAWLVNYGTIWAQSIELALEKGVVTLVDKTEETFGMETLLVDTELFFTNYSRKSVIGAQEWINAKKAAGEGWHEHTVTVLDDCAETCTSNGYIGRTYCVVCDSVVDWGTVLPATGHVYNIVDNKLVCDCGIVADINGLYECNGKNYYALAGELVSGWISVKNEWYYFDATTFAGLDGKCKADGSVVFTFENGRLTTGTWTKTANGMRYWYGPGYYRDTTYDAASCRPCEIDGKIYLFNRQGYMQTGIVHQYIGDNTIVYYDCGDDGVATLLNGPANGYFYIDGVRQSGYKLVEFEGGYYFINGKMLTMNKRGYLSEQFVAGTPLTAGYYDFDENGKIVIKNGPIDGYFYVDGVKQTGYKLVEFEGGYYFINGQQLTVGKTGYLSEKFVAGTDLTAGYYYFDETGKIVMETRPFDGYYYVNGIRQTGYMLIEYEGGYYFLNGDKLTVNKRGYLSEKFVAGTSLKAGYYDFDENGKIIIKNGPIDGYYYVDGIKQTGYMLIEYEGGYYFLNGDKLTVNKRGYLSEKFVAGTNLKAGYYDFDENGKIIIKNGPVDGYFYIDGIKQTGYKLVEFEGDYYFINGSALTVNRVGYLSAQFVDGTMLEPGYYTFDATGKIVFN